MYKLLLGLRFFILIQKMFGVCCKCDHYSCLSILSCWVFLVVLGVMCVFFYLCFFGVVVSIVV